MPENVNLEPEINEDFFENQEIQEENEFLEAFKKEPSNQVEDIEKPSDDNVDGDSADDADKDEFKFEDVVATAEAEELADVNAKYNTDFKSIKEFKQALGTKERSISTEEQTYQQNLENITSLTNYIEMKSEPLMREKLIADAVDNGKDPKSETLIEEINLKLEQWIDNDTIDLRADALKKDLALQIKEKTAFNENFTNTITKEKEQKVLSQKQALQQATKDIYTNSKGKFLDVVVTKEDYTNAYQDVVNNKVINHIQNNPTDAIKVALFLKKQKELNKRVGGPTYSDGVKDTYNELSGKASSKNQNATPKKDDVLSDSGNASLVESFVL